MRPDVNIIWVSWHELVNAEREGRRAQRGSTGQGYREWNKFALIYSARTGSSISDTFKENLVYSGLLHGIRKRDTINSTISSLSSNSSLLLCCSALFIPLVLLGTYITGTTTNLRTGISRKGRNFVPSPLKTTFYVKCLCFQEVFKLQ